MLKYWSLSFLECSCSNPSECKISCSAVPDLCHVQSFPNEIIQGLELKMFPWVYALLL